MTRDQWLDAVLRREGWPAFTDRPSDRGGPTKGGITLSLLRAVRQDPTVTVEDDLRQLSEREARVIYTVTFWAPFDWLKPIATTQALAADWAVMSGVRHVTKAAQRALGVVPDGFVGPKTLSAWGMLFLRAKEDIFHYRLWQARLRFYVDIALNDEDTVAFLRSCPTTQLHNLRGWLNRALETPATPDAGGGRDPNPSLPSAPRGAADSPPGG